VNSYEAYDKYFKLGGNIERVYRRAGIMCLWDIKEVIKNRFENMNHGTIVQKLEKIERN
jgi:hypothetical protein